MARINIKDLPRDMKISAEEMKRVKGGITLTTSPLTSATDYIKLDTTLDGKGELTSDLKLVSDVINPTIGINEDKW